MTRVQMHFRLRKPLDEVTMTRLSGESTLYGIQQVKLEAALDGLMVEYDASRLRPACSNKKPVVVIRPCGRSSGVIRRSPISNGPRMTCSSGIK